VKDFPLEMTGARQGDSPQQSSGHSNRRTACEYHVSNSAPFPLLLRPKSGVNDSTIKITQKILVVMRILERPVLGCE
jgi:hypothetical protein